MVDVNREVPLFDKPLAVQVQQSVDGCGSAPLLPLLPPSLNTSELSRCSQPLVVRVLTGSQPTTVIGQHETVYHFEVTDDRDPYFLFTFDVGEHSFTHFKRDQSILVDFHVFPQMFIELLELCLSTGNSLSTSSSANDSESSFTAKLDTTSGCLSIIESNRFKQLTHISLPMQRGDDAAIKLYLASRLALTLDLSKRLHNQNDSLSLLTKEQEGKIADMSSELERLRTQRALEMQSIEATHSQEMSMLQRASMESADSTRAKFEAQLDILRQNLEKTQELMRERSLAMESQIQELTHEKNQQDFKLRDLTRQLASASQDRDRLLKECEQTQSFRRQLDDEQSQTQREQLRLESRLEALQQALKDKEENVQKSVLLQRASEEAKAAIEEKIQIQMQRSAELEDELLLTHEEIDKLTAVVNKQLSEARQLKDKLKIKNEVIRRQETLVNELRTKQIDCEQQLLASKENVQSSGHQLTLLTTRVSEANAKAEEYRKLLDEQKQVVAYLSDEVNRFQLGERLNAEPVFPKTSFLPTTTSSNATAAHLRYGSPSTPTIAYTAPSMRTLSANRLATATTPTADYTTTDGVVLPRTAPHLVQENLSSKLQAVQGKGRVTGNNESQQLMMKGLQTLGMSHALVDQDLGFDVLQSEGSSIESSGYNYQKRKNAKPSAAMNIDELDYYALDGRTPQEATKYKYAWQDPDFGKYD